MITIAPEASAGYAFLSRVLNFVGKPDDAIALAKKAMQLDAVGGSNGSVWTRMALGRAYRLIGRHKEALAELRAVFAINPEFILAYKAHIDLAIIYSELDREEEARAEAAEILELVPSFSVVVWGQREPFKDPAQTERDMAYLRKVGLK
jgi:tetratricopeptide (TPR) repeat protein